MLGAGSWGTALAIHLARRGHDTVLWGRDAEALSALAREGRNTRYLPQIPLPESLGYEPSLADAVASADLVLLVPPSHGFAELLQSAVPHLSDGARVAWACKGFEPGSGRLLHEVAASMLDDTLCAVVTGPSFAVEVARGLPTAITVASESESFARQAAARLHGDNLRVYTSTDVIGAELGGAVKNVMAVATGISDGMGLGDNSRAALITRGLAEIVRMGAALGARPETLYGLSGMGDLVLTCTGDLSRNRRLGLALGRAQSLESALADIGQVVEGVSAAAEVHRLAGKLGVEMPISDQVHAILENRITPQQGLKNLLARQRKAEVN